MVHRPTRRGWRGAVNHLWGSPQQSWRRNPWAEVVDDTRRSGAHTSRASSTALPARHLLARLGLGPGLVDRFQNPGGVLDPGQQDIEVLYRHVRPGDQAGDVRV